MVRGRDSITAFSRSTCGDVISPVPEDVEESVLAGRALEFGASVATMVMATPTDAA